MLNEFETVDETSTRKAKAESLKPKPRDYRLNLNLNRWRLNGAVVQRLRLVGKRQEVETRSQKTKTKIDIRPTFRGMVLLLEIRSASTFRGRSVLPVEE